MHVGDLYDTKFGTLEVVEYTNKSKVRVRFIETGYEKFARYNHILNGSVKDNLKPSVFGVGFIGDEVTRTKKVDLFLINIGLGCYKELIVKSTKLLRTHISTVQPLKTLNLTPTLKSGVKDKLAMEIKDGL